MSFEFGGAREIDGKIAQHVHIIDADGGLWEARYTLEPRADGSLKIIGCVLKVVGQAVRTVTPIAANKRAVNPRCARLARPIHEHAG